MPSNSSLENFSSIGNPMTKNLSSFSSWFKIRAKYNTKCPLCNEAIQRGSEIMWQQGAKAVHPKCHTVAQMVPLTSFMEVSA